MGERSRRRFVDSQKWPKTTLPGWLARYVHVSSVLLWAARLARIGGLWMRVATPDPATYKDTLGVSVWRTLALVLLTVHAIAMDWPTQMGLESARSVTLTGVGGISVTDVTLSPHTSSTINRMTYASPSGSVSPPSGPVEVTGDVELTVATVVSDADNLEIVSL